jgi:hypothetical protein
MPDELNYDLMLEVEGVLRSISMRARLPWDLRVGETLDLHGRQWVVLKVDQVDHVDPDDLDRRVLAREVETDVAA